LDVSLEATVVTAEDWLVDSFAFCQHWTGQIRGCEGPAWSWTVRKCAKSRTWKCLIIHIITHSLSGWGSVW